MTTRTKLKTRTSVCFLNCVYSSLISWEYSRWDDYFIGRHPKRWLGSPERPESHKSRNHEARRTIVEHQYGSHGSVVALCLIVMHWVLIRARCQPFLLFPKAHIVLHMTTASTSPQSISQTFQLHQSSGRFTPSKSRASLYLSQHFVLPLRLLFCSFSWLDFLNFSEADKVSETEKLFILYRWIVPLQPTDDTSRYEAIDVSTPTHISFLSQRPRRSICLEACRGNSGFTSAGLLLSQRTTNLGSLSREGNTIL